MVKIIGVYGTLRKDEGANYKLSNCECIGIFREKIPFQMYNLGWYPCLTQSEEENEITLELYKVDENTEKMLDSYEGYPSLYQKSIININDMEVTIYSMKNGKIGSEYIVKSGDWLNR